MRQGSHTYSYSWASALSLTAKREILSLTNIIIKSTDTIGFHRPLTDQEGVNMLSLLDREIRQGKKHLLLIKDRNSVLIGHVLLAQNSLPNCYHRAELSRAMISPVYRCPFLIKEGMKQLLEKCEEIGVSSLELDVRANTSLYRLWRKFGFEVIGKNPDYVRVNDEIISGFYMRQSVELLKKNLLEEK